jgi:Tfp pilus assembly protein PilF
MYQAGRAHWGQRTISDVERSIDLLHQALEKDPTYARAHAALAESWVLMGYLGGVAPDQAYPKAARHARDALELEPRLSSAHNALAYTDFAYHWHWKHARRGFERALKLNPNDATARHWFGWFLAARGEHEAAGRQLAQAERLDPASLAIPTSAGFAELFARDYVAALETFARVLDRRPDYLLALLGGAMSAELQGQSEHARHLLERAEALGERASAMTRSVAGFVHARAGRKQNAREALAELQSRAQSAYVPAVLIARVHAALNQPDQAERALERATLERSEYLTTLGVDPTFDALRDRPGFQAVLQRVGLDEATRPDFLGP